MIDLSHITSKFPHYQSEESLSAYRRRAAPLISKFMKTMLEEIRYIRDVKKLQFTVFSIADRTLHCGLFYC